ASEYGAEIAGALSRPNDTLGVEYIKALEKLGSSITPFAVRRIGAKHDAADGAGGFLSASAIRESIRGGDGDFASMSCLETAVLSALRQMSASQLSQLPDVSEGLDNRIYFAVRECTSLESLLDAVKTRRYTHSRLRRIIMSAYLGLTAEYSCEPPPYIRVLGFSDGGREILRCAKKNASLPVVTKYSDISALGANAVRVFELECRAADLYALAFRVPKPCGAEMTHGIVTVEKN
ncbi:MAG: nucleotidyltransferase family protein, partial [Clostridiales bacterium]|nr:nucleotidyltransferase family protein [Clostridiales bacterium]